MIFNVSKNKFKILNIGLSVCVGVLVALGGSEKVYAEISAYVYDDDASTCDQEDSSEVIDNHQPIYSYQIPSYSYQPSYSCPQHIYGSSDDDYEKFSALKSLKDYLKKYEDEVEIPSQSFAEKNKNSLKLPEFHIKSDDFERAIADEKVNSSGNKNANVITSVNGSNFAKPNTVLVSPRTYLKPVNTYATTTVAAAGSPPSPPDVPSTVQPLNENQTAIVQIDFVCTYVSFININLVSVYHCASSAPGVGTGKGDFYKTCDILTIQILIGLGIVLIISFLCIWIYLKRNRLLTLLKNLRPVRSKKMILSYE